MAHKLLLADDSVTIQRVIELTFADEDVDVTTVGDGQMAIDLLDTTRFDIILADVDMPKRDGYEVAAYVKSRPKLAHIPVVLLTGAFEPIDQARATAAGSSDVLAKPFEPQMVINRVKELLGKKRSDGEDAYASHEAGAPQSLQPSMGNPQPAGEGTQQPVSLDDYFDQLDAAFSNLQPGAPPAETADGMDWPVHLPEFDAAVEPSPVPPSPPASARQNAPPPMLEPVVMAPPSAAAAVAATPVSSTFAAQPPVAPVASSFATRPSVAPDAPYVANAPNAPSVGAPAKNPFANLSAAKAEAAARPAPAAPVITDEVIDQIVSRVIQRMTDRVIREAVADVVTQTAERLVQEEIERIRTGS
ncbi:MAG TPA: response regulator [Vicinamibacterales bacterium]|nr:response regulator [Vicinamibacterales bacterium]